MTKEELREAEAIAISLVNAIENREANIEIGIPLLPPDISEMLLLAKGFKHLLIERHWIPVEEDLPMQRQDRIAVIVDGSILQDLHYYLEGRGFYCYAPPSYMTGIKTDNVTHWMQIPPPPELEK